MFVFWLLFLISLVLMAAHYVLFPLFLATLARTKRKNFASLSSLPSATIVVAAYNESKVIVEKIQNCLELDYPVSEMETIIVTDGSSDDSPQKASVFSAQGVQVLHETARRGKSAALNRAVAQAKGEVLLFTDANTFLEPAALKRLANHFADPSVGAVSGRKQIYSNDQREAAKGDRTFWNFESRLKSWQSRVGSVSTGDGEIFAVRRSLYRPIPSEVINDDMELTLSIIEQGYRVLYDETAIAYEDANKTLQEDFKVKARMVYGGYQAIARHAPLLSNPFRFFSIQFALHKTLRYAMPLLLILLFMNSAVLAFSHPSPLLTAILSAQILFYLASILGLFLKRSGTARNPFYFPLYFSYMNYAALVGLFYFLRQRSLTSIWQKAER